MPPKHNAICSDLRKNESARDRATHRRIVRPLASTYERGQDQNGPFVWIPVVTGGLLVARGFRCSPEDLPVAIGGDPSRPRAWRLLDGYAVVSTEGTVKPFHRMVCTPRPGEVVDHISRNRRDNRRGNLRSATLSTNALNAEIRKRPGATSRFLHVTRSTATVSERWQAACTFRGRCFHVGLFRDEEQAARAADQMAFALWGAEARLNFPEEVVTARTKRAA